ncbi:dihydrodipicolinate synthase family protein [Massilibacteroides sp.]|uniref:dihydrodipicolinate synthase family protein n=1 Tax=Massilibacteroides sp. TaxID=2034766 RepID=UPI00261ACF9A|nr:dihydrodipicolinate synthase family protein [Massilibacteroides sp.]MDD4515892.1 dihydrodipicolinate synthase family protein [Massilibacteroides sp.]
MKNYQRLEGMVAASFTPMTLAGDLNLDAIASYADLMAKSGVTGVFVCGTTGEATSLTVEERKKVLVRWVEETEGRFKVIAHVGSNCQLDAIELARHAMENGAWGIGAIAPSFFKPATVAELIRFFKPIAAAAPEIPFYYYNMPAMTGVDLSVAHFLKEGKKEIPNLAGTKFTHNNLMEMAQCLNLDNGTFEVLHGYDEILTCGLALGAKAGVGSTYNYIPSVYAGIFESMKKNDLVTARALQKKSVEVVEVIIKYGGGVRGGKAIMNLIGVECGDCRSPIASFTNEEYNSLKEDLNKIGFFEIK